MFGAALQRQGQRAAVDSVRDGANSGDVSAIAGNQEKQNAAQKSKRRATLDDVVRRAAKEALVGVEPTMADLQSAALATWLQRPNVLLTASLRN